MEKDIPHGHGGSFKKGLVDSLLSENDYNDSDIPNDLPHGHDKSYRRGRSEGDLLRKNINQRVKA